MRHQNLINTILPSLGLSVLLAFSSCQATQDKRPNIVYLFTDQQTADAMSCAGNPYLKTPGMDKIAAMGVRFENCYATQPLCCPNRTCMFTGLYPHQSGVVVNMPADTNLVGNHPMLAKLLQDSGYQTGLFGKWHIASTTKNKGQNGFDEIWSDPVKSHKNYDDLVAEKVLRFATQVRKGPFFVVGSFINPHNICELARGNEKKEIEFPNSEITGFPDPRQCPPLPDNFKIPDNEPGALRGIHDDPDHWRQYPTKDWTEDDWRQYLWGYYRLIEHVDQSILKVVNGLQDAGLLENTIIVFSSDHGEGLAQHHWNQKQVLYESAVHIPFVVAWKGVTKPASVNQALVSNGLDLMPTICDYAGVASLGGYFGKSVRPLVDGTKEKIHDYVVSETAFASGTDEYGLSGRCVRGPRYKYVVYSDGALREQLFDMENDAGEMDNLAVNENFKGVLEEQRNLLRQWGEKTADDFNFMP